MRQHDPFLGAGSLALFVTTDPDRDPAPVLKANLDRIHPDLVGLTGDLATIAAVGKSGSVSIDGRLDKPDEWGRPSNRLPDTGP